MSADVSLDLLMQPFDITYSDLRITVFKLHPEEFQLYHNDELVALMTPKMVGGDLKWFSPQMVAIDAELIGAVIASRLIEIH